MPRLPRIHVPGGFYHVTLRGNHQEDLFSTAADRRKLNAIVAEAIEKYGARIHAFCWMTNHIHALIQIGVVKLGKVMHHVARQYSRYRHKKLGKKGTLYDKPYEAELIDVDAYFVAVLRYIHRNPVEARMVQSADEYPWSSHHAYCGREVVPWLTTDFGLSMLGRTFAGALDAYQRMVQGERGEYEVDPFSLVRSDDRRVIGTDRFLASLPPPRVQPKSQLTLEELALEVCVGQKVSLPEVRSPSRHRRLTAARLAIARRAADERVASHHAVARFLGRSPSAICQLLKRRGAG